MWIMTTGGFVSAVEHRDDASMLMVRARDFQSLETMRLQIPDNEKIRIYSESGSDYRWRAVVSKEQFKTYLASEVDDYLDYPNFKNRVTGTLGQKWHDAYLAVWTTMLRMVPDRHAPEKPAPADNDEIHLVDDESPEDWESIIESWEES